jgi:hypothetical protein
LCEGLITNGVPVFGGSKNLRMIYVAPPQTAESLFVRKVGSHIKKRPKSMPPQAFNIVPLQEKPEARALGFFPTVKA